MSELFSVTLVDPSLFRPTGAAADLVGQARDLVAEINARRPLPEHIVKRLQQEILFDRVHSSAVTEGNRLSRRETIVILTSGLVEAGARKDMIEVNNLAMAILELEKALEDGIPLSSQLLRHLHGVLLKDLDNSAGAFRTENVAISGARLTPPHFHDVPELVDTVLKKLSTQNDEYDTIQLAAWAHWAIARIHPFRDGNGRVARLVQDYVLLKGRYIPAPLQSEDREGVYYAALEAADAGDGKSLVEMLAKNVVKIGDKYNAIVRDEEAKRSWVAQITRAATEKVKESQHRKFLAMQRASNILKSEFASLCQELDDGIPQLTVTFLDYGSLTFEQFQELQKRGKASRTWFFGTEFRISDTVLRYMFWYGIHRSRPYDISADLPSSVVLLVSVEEQHNYYRLLDELVEDRVSCRELVPAGASFWRRRLNPISGEDEWDQNVMAGQVARDFFQEVLGKLGLI